jgi:hypothetical protein
MMGFVSDILPICLYVQKCIVFVLFTRRTSWQEGSASGQHLAALALLQVRREESSLIGVDTDISPIFLSFQKLRMHRKVVFIRHT